MANLIELPRIGVEAKLILTLDELRAFHFITQYGSDALIMLFSNGLNRSETMQHEKALRSFFDTIRAKVPTILDHFKKAEEAFHTGD